LEEYNNLGNYHHLGGTKIGDSVNNSVVDKNLKVHNISNLFVSGSSVFNYGTNKNPTFSIMQLSIMVAENLKKKLFKFYE
jgi:choline dehydrogenase-like flavoprotein